MSTVRRLECEDCGCPVDDQDGETGLWWCDKCDDGTHAVAVIVTPESEARLITPGPHSTTRFAPFWILPPSSEASS